MVQNKGKAEKFLSNILRGGLIIALLAIFVGEAFLLFSHGHEPIPDYKTFHEPTRTPLAQDIKLEMLGIWLLAATPVARITACVLIFAFQHDTLYVVISSIVLFILAFSFLS